MANNITTVVNYQVTQAIKALQDTQKELGQTEMSGADLADALAKGAANAQAELDKIKAAAAAMSQSLGDDFVQARADAGVSVEDIVMELNRLGASFDEIAAHSDKLATSVKQLDAVQAPMRKIRPAADDAAAGLDRVRESGDQSRSVLANMVGNSAQDLGALSGVAGSAGVALGQFAEYAADGNISLKGLAGAGAGVAVLSAGMLAANEAAKQAALNIELMAEAVDKLSTASDDQTLEYFYKRIQAGQLTGESLSETFRTMAEENLPGFKRAVELAGESGQYTAEQLDLMRSAIKEAERAAAQGAETNREYATATEAVAAAAEHWSATLGEATAGARYQAQAVSILRDRLEQYRDELGGIPIEIDTEIKAALNAGDLARAEALLNEVARSRIVQVGIAINSGAAAGAAAGIGQQVGQGISTAIANAIAGAKMPSSVTGGGGGGGSSPAQEEANGWDAAIAKAYEYGEVTRQEYIDYLNMRMAGEDRYSEEYYRLWKIRQGLEKQIADEAEAKRKEQERAEKEAADEAKRRADELKKAAEDAAKASEQLTINVYSNSLDPMAVARAIEQAKRMAGSRFLQP